MFTIFVLHAEAHTFIGKAKKPRAFKNIAPTAVPFSHKWQNTWMDSEIFRGHFVINF